MGSRDEVHRRRHELRGRGTKQRVDREGRGVVDCDSVGPSAHTAPGARAYMHRSIFDKAQAQMRSEFRARRHCASIASTPSMSSSGIRRSVGTNIRNAMTLTELRCSALLDHDQMTPRRGNFAHTHITPSPRPLRPPRSHARTRRRAGSSK